MSPCITYIFGSLAFMTDSLFATILLGLSALYGLYAPYLIIKIRRQLFSYFVVDERGITNKIFLLKNEDIFIAWDEMNDIAIKPIGKGHGVYSEYMYFCKVPLDEYWYPNEKRNFFNRMPAYKDSYGLGQSENMFSITYSKRLLEEVLKYVDKEKIRNLHTVFP